jgi:hypothetical protein
MEHPSSRRHGGWGGIRTLETVARLPVFKTGAFNHSATHPACSVNRLAHFQEKRVHFSARKMHRI